MVTVQTASIFSSWWQSIDVSVEVPDARPLLAGNAGYAGWTCWLCTGLDMLGMLDMCTGLDMLGMLAAGWTWWILLAGHAEYGALNTVDRPICMSASVAVQRRFTVGRIVWPNGRPYRVP